MRQRQSENKYRAIVAVLAGRVAKITVGMLSWQAGSGEGSHGYRASASSERKYQGGLLLRGTRLLQHFKEFPQWDLVCAGNMGDRMDSNSGSASKQCRGGFCLTVADYGGSPRLKLTILGGWV